MPIRLILAALLTALAAPSIRAGTATLPATRPASPPAEVTREEVDRLFGPLIDGQWSPGIVVGIVTPEGTRVFGYGRLSAKDQRRPDGKTVFEIGSVSKVFTSTLLGMMVVEGKMGQDDPVQKYLPDSVTMPKKGDREITLQHLATHFSGLPRMPGNFSPADPANPYADYTAERMYAFLNESKPAREAGEGFEYSNLAVGLLGNVIARKADKPYEQLLAERITRPLLMKDTSIALSDDQKKRFAPPHNVDGAPDANWDIPGLAGAGAIRSTADDLLKFLAAQFDAAKTEAARAGEEKATNKSLADAMRMTHIKRQKVSPNADIGLGWFINSRNGTLDHGGRTGGYQTFIAFSPRERIGVAVLSNASGARIEAPAGALLARMMGGELKAPALPGLVKVEAKTLDRYVGRYLMLPLTFVTITREQDRLYAQLTGQPKFRVWPDSATHFYWRVVEANMGFVDGANGDVLKLILHQNGKDMTGWRLRPEEKHAPDGGEGD